MRHKKQFYFRVINDNPYTETARLLQENDDCGYYELCQRFVDVALNAPIIKNENGSLSGVFQHTDIAVAKEKAVAFIRKPLRKAPLNSRRSHVSTKLKSTPCGQRQNKPTRPTGVSTNLSKS